MAVIRTDRGKEVLPLVRSVVAGGIDLIEISSPTPGWDGVIYQLQAELPQVLVGVGTITDRSTAKRAIEVGGKFLFSPIYDQSMVDLAREQGVPIVAGASTPNEILRAWQGGATAVKVFPIANLGGASYIRAIKTIFPTIPLIPTGGVTLKNARELLEAGAVGIGVGGYFFPPDLIQTQNWQGITDRVRELQTSLILHNSTE